MQKARRGASGGKKPGQPTGTKATKGPSLTPAQLRGDERIELPDGRWYYVQWDERGQLITDPEVCGIWEIGEDGRPVTWVSQAQLADWLDVTPRWLQKLDAKGLPARGFRDTCEYPVPHSMVWWIQYKVMLAKGPVQHLSMSRAWAEHERQEAIADAESRYREATDPAYRARIKKLEAEVSAEAPGRDDDP